MDGLSTWIKAFRELGKVVDKAPMGEQVLDEQTVCERMKSADLVAPSSIRETTFTGQNLADTQACGVPNEDKSHWFDEVQYFSPGNAGERYKTTCNTWTRLNNFIQTLDAEEKKQLMIQGND